MALKLISLLSFVIFASFTYKVWDKTKVPKNIPAEDAWKVKTIEFASRVCQKLADFVQYFEGDVHSLRPFMSFIFNSLHYGVWPFSSIYLSRNDSLVMSEFTEMNGVPVFVYENTRFQSGSRPVLIYFHGGGWEWLNADDPSPTLRSLTRELGIVSISVDYRLAPENPYPAGLNDCLKVAEYVLNNYRSLRIDPTKVMVGGDNSGGNLAAAVALKLKKKLRLQILIYPVLQALDFQTPAYRENYGKFKYILKAEKVAKSIAIYGGLPNLSITEILENRHAPLMSNYSKYRKYIHTSIIPEYRQVTNLSTMQNYIAGNKELSDLVEGRFLDPYFMPLMSGDLNGTTNAYIVTAQHDVLRDDGLIYAARLSNASNVEVKVYHYPDAFHNFFHFSEGPLRLRVAHQGLGNLISFIKSNVVLDSFDK